MDARGFVERNRGAWERLETLLGRSGLSGLSSLSPAELQELGTLHRQVAADLAAARTYHAESKIVGYLNQLALRSHNAVYRAPKRKALQVLAEFVDSIPRTVRRRRGALAASALIFFLGGVLGAVGTAIDESVADMLLGTEFTERVRHGSFWIDDVTETWPESALSGVILTNNLWVSLQVFAMGFTGVLSAMMLFFNGVMLGTVVVLCGQYGLLPRFVPFVMGHGVIEISAVLLAGAGGFCIFDGWLHPGDKPRLQGLREGARDGLAVFAAAIPALLVAGPVEGLVSTAEAIPGYLRIGMGILLGVLYWTWLLSWDGKRPLTDDPVS
jgi:uncharacterized membrane protein SpoIIM required for sporulation